MGLLRNILDGAIVLVGDAIETVGSGEGRRELLERIRKAADRGAELALENARLRDRVDELRFNGPTLWVDEVDALEYALTTLHPDAHDERRVLRALLQRCDHLPLTSAQLAEQVDGILDGTVPALLWDDVGKDVDRDPMPCHCGWDFNYGDTCPHGTKGQGA